jgi:hypothetical protein
VRHHRFNFFGKLGRFFQKGREMSSELEPEYVSTTPTLMRETFFKTTFYSTALIATGGWVWLLYVAVEWII